MESIKPLRSLKLPNDNIYHVVQPYSFSGSLTPQNALLCAYFSEKDSNFKGNIEVYYNNQHATVYYDRDKSEYSLIAGSIANMEMWFKKYDGTNNVAIFLHSSSPESKVVVVQISNAYDITRPENINISREEVSLLPLSSNSAPSTVYSGRGAPGADLGNVGDIYIQIITSAEGTDSE